MIQTEIEYINQFDNLYPGIELWYKRALSDPHKNIIKVISSRISDEDRIMGLVVVDIPQGKLCHLSVADWCKGKVRRWTRRYLYQQAILTFQKYHINHIIAHGTPEVVDKFCKVFPGWEIIRDLHNYGRGGEPDQMITINLGNKKR